MKNNNRWLGITCSRNEADFIESFIRGNSRYIDKFVIVDDSTDNTVDILKRLRKEGFDIEVIVQKGIVSDQKVKTNWMFQKFADPNKFSAVIPLDVDEIVVPKSAGDKKENIRLENAASFLDWVPFAPITLNWPNSAGGLAGSFVPTFNQIGRVKKILLPRSCLTNKGIIDLGAHNYHVDDKPSVEGVNSQLALAHFPIRSKEQLISKLATYMAAVRLKKKKAPSENLHYPELVKMIIRTDFSPGIGDLQVASALYGNYFDKKAYQLLTESVSEYAQLYRDSLSHVNLIYKDFAEVNLIRNLYQLSSELTDQLVTEFSISPKIDRHYRVRFKK
jgi:hypothetical protein